MAYLGIKKCTCIIYIFNELAILFFTSDKTCSQKSTKSKEWLTELVFYSNCSTFPRPLRLLTVSLLIKNIGLVGFIVVNYDLHPWLRTKAPLAIWPIDDSRANLSHVMWQHCKLAPERFNNNNNNTWLFCCWQRLCLRFGNGYRFLWPCLILWISQQPQVLE